MDKPDFKQLCAELADSIELLLEMRPVNARPLQITEDRLARARAALAEPEPEGPTDEELLRIAAAAIDGYGDGINPGEYESATECAIEVYGSELCDFARAVWALGQLSAANP